LSIFIDIIVSDSCQKLELTLTLIGPLPNHRGQRGNPNEEDCCVFVWLCWGEEI
jgi:hypothetical protein